jgi:hypothetical protein
MVSFGLYFKVLAAAIRLLYIFSTPFLHILPTALNSLFDLNPSKRFNPLLLLDLIRPHLHVPLLFKHGLQLQHNLAFLLLGQLLGLGPSHPPLVLPDQRVVSVLDPVLGPRVVHHLHDLAP